MSRKTKESPLNLIRILPPKEGGASPSHKYNPASTHFKLKLDGEEASRSMLSLGWLVGLFDSMFRGIGRLGSWILHQVKSVIHWCAQGILQIGQLTQFLVERTIKPARKLSGGIQSSGKQLWNDITPGKKPPVSESILKERSKQRETLIEEVHALRTQLTTHQDELIRVTAQMEELKALVSSQQQVLLHLGKELEATERNESPPEKLTIRKTKPRGSKPSQSDKSESSEPLPSTQFEFGPPHH
jgi:hypothetical protein